MHIHHYESLLDYTSGEFVGVATNEGSMHQPQYEFYETPPAGLEATFGGYAAFANEYSGVDVENHHHHLGKPFST